MVWQHRPWGGCEILQRPPVNNKELRPRPVLVLALVIGTVLALALVIGTVLVLSLVIGTVLVLTLAIEVGWLCYSKTIPHLTRGWVALLLQDNPPFDQRMGGCATPRQSPPILPEDEWLYYSKTIRSFDQRMESNCLQLLDIRVPQFAELYDSVTLSCEFDLAGGKLYSVKWYKDDFEFFRYIPDNNPPSSALPLPGIHVELSLSNMTTLRLTKLSFASTGTYSCEVSMEAPKFNTVMNSRNMTVRVLSARETDTSQTFVQVVAVVLAVVTNTTESRSSDTNTYWDSIELVESPWRDKCRVLIGTFDESTMEVKVASDPLVRVKRAESHGIQRRDAPRLEMTPPHDITRDTLDWFETRHREIAFSSRQSKHASSITLLAPSHFCNKCLSPTLLFQVPLSHTSVPSASLPHFCYMCLSPTLLLHVPLSHTSVTCASISQTSVTCASLSQTSVTCASFPHTSVTSASLSHTYVTSASLSHTSVTSASLSHTSVTSASLSHPPTSPSSDPFSNNSLKFRYCVPRS
uniref:Ig-like domain-containing protein n=1 Tax=Timema bartmani TaxID=61472 RepID=A0A7R9EXM6_9NEOP|nr:unnamed protein product [Timema bartmani]